MNQYLIFFVLSFAVVATWCFTWWMRKYALSRHMIDIPNARSSHKQPTPRGGGVAFVVVFVVCGAVLAWSDLVPVRTFFAVAGAAVWVAAIGFFDDKGHIKARWRLLAHIVAAIWVLVFLGNVPVFSFLGLEIPFHWFWLAFWALFVIWMINLFNFMDGIDGLAAGQAVFVSAAGALLYWIAGYKQETLLPLLLAVSVLGFLFWNFPPAKIFMGDAGSGFLGFVLSAFSLQAASLQTNVFFGWLILSGVFVVDATFTLLRRLLSGRRVYEAHRTHAYQYAARHFGGHRSVTVGIYALNLLWLLPLAILVSTARLSIEIGLMLAYAPLVVLVVYFKAGKSELTSSDK